MTEPSELPDPAGLAEELWEAAADLEDEGSLVAAAELYRQAVTAYESADQEQTARRLELHLAGLLTSIGDADSAHSALGRIQDWARRDGDRLLQAAVWVEQAELEVDQGLDLVGDQVQPRPERLDEAAVLIDRAVRELEAHPGEHVPLHVRSLVLAGEISTLRGRHTDAVARLDAALACASAHADQFTDQPALIDEIVLDLAEAAVASEQPERATQVFHDARRRALRDRDEEGVWLWTLHLGRHLVVLGDRDAGRQWLTRLRDQLEIAGDQDYLPEVRDTLAALDHH